jgi:hypothetical protein
MWLRDFGFRKIGNSNIKYKITEFTTRLPSVQFRWKFLLPLTNAIISQLLVLTTAGLVTHNSAQDDMVSNMNNLDQILVLQA